MANPDKFVQIGGESFRVEEMGAWLNMDLNHERIHLGNMFHADYYNSSLANGGTALLTIKPSTASPHMVYGVQVGGNAEFSIVEAGTVTGDGTITTYNRHRESTTTPYAAVTTGGTITGGVTMLDFFVVGGSGGNKAGSGSRGDVEWILNAAKNYTLKVINNSGSSAGVSISIDWYEQDED